MRVLIIPDKFKGSLTAQEVSVAITLGLESSYPGVETQTVIASDGGDGFLESVRQNVTNPETIRCATFDPLGREMEAEYLFDSSQTAFIEMAQASGLVLLKPEERDPMLTSTVGTGVLIRDALQRGAKRVFVGLGGSATNDGGIGIAAALGYRFLDSEARELKPIGGRLGDIASIDTSEVTPLLADVDVLAINDVVNPLLGVEGAAHVYGPQKGASQDAVEQLDAGLQNLDHVVQSDLKVEGADVPGAGAAGGTGFGLHVFSSANFVSGIEFVLQLAGVEGLLAEGNIDWIVTGEGKIDDQTAYGKLVRGVAVVGERHGVPVVAICGKLDLKQQSIASIGLSSVTAIHDRSRPLRYTMEHAAELVEAAARTILLSDSR